jgi:predicted benzoate:H+ symporter BenE
MNQQKPQTGKQDSSAKVGLPGVFTALVVAMSNIVIFKISSPFWALVIGVAVSVIAETGDFKAQSKD